MNNEPVAWMSQGGDVSRSRDYFEEMGFKDLIPLYTHPVKQLSDEEMKAILLSYALADEYGYYSIGEEHFDAIIKEITE